MTTVARRSFHDRVALDRDGVAAHTGAARTTVINWIQNRARFGFPNAFTDGSGREWFWVDDIDAFRVAHKAAKLAELTKVDRTGDPNELVTSGEAARILGYSSYRNLPDELTGHPDDIEILSDGRRRRFWYRRTVWAHADARTGRRSTGHAPRTTGPRKAYSYSDDPRLQVAADLLAEVKAAGRDRRGLGAELARRLGIRPRTAQRLLAAVEGDQPN
ncbi:hypothetical protein FB565_002963 [Actinoplanes lutulentus]|uniref:Uncharacterized protein n=1 Tax=Actinoplanes lutulentus TaxID=1287878 RepID=A0A327Z9W3_9ACTN|nr:hypothetical protein [Actinoplanes lutulentus]MBB2943250.1 hypothetical protein [Actinoplanes lutulentus]RAK28311.1 hypothetical protein B0I29_12079 [Actinoplanes lutulentus]